MGAKTLISEADYLRMGFDGADPDYVEGQVVQRSMPNNDHSVTAFAFYLIFGRLMRLAPLFPRPEIRLRVGPGRFRVADLAVYAHLAPSAEIPPEIPYVVVEVISPDDRYDDLMVKLADYQNCGIPHIWLADPALRRLSIYRDGNLTSVGELALPEFHLAIGLAEIFA